MSRVNFPSLNVNRIENSRKTSSRLPFNSAVNQDAFVSRTNKNISFKGLKRKFSNLPLLKILSGMKEADDIVSHQEPYNPHIPDQLEKTAEFFIDSSGTSTIEALAKLQLQKGMQNKENSKEILQQANDMGIADNLLNQLNGDQANNKTKKQLYQEVIEKSTGGTKILQTLSSNEDFMSKLSPDLQEVIHNLKSNCKPSRTLDEAKEEIKDLWGDRFTIDKRLKAASVGETYLGTDKTSDKTVVVKMIKKGLDDKYLDQDKKLLLCLLKNNLSDPEELNGQTKFIDQLYKQWKKELKLSQESENIKKISANAERYTVSQAIDQKGNVLVMELSPGLSFDDIFKMLQFREKMGHKSYIDKYSNALSKNPWMKTPDKYTEKLARIYIAACNEMILLPKRDGNYLHGDPHPGNVFAPDLSASGAKPNFIDNGLIFYRSKDESIENIGYMFDYLTGNTKNLAKRIVNGAESLPEGQSKNELTGELKDLLDKRIFKSNHNITNPNYNQQIIDDILEKLEIKIPENEAGYLKASLEFAFVASALDRQAGKSVYTRLLVPDVMLGIWRSFKINPIKTMKQINPAVKHIIIDGKTTGRTVGQFFPKQSRSKVIHKCTLGLMGKG